MKANKIILNNEVLIDLTADTVTQNDVKKGVTFHGRDGVEYEGTYEVALQSKTVTPTKESQIVESDAPYEGLSKVNVGAIPKEYVIPTETTTLTANTTVPFDTTNYKEINVAVPLLTVEKAPYTITSNDTYTPDKLGMTADGIGEFTVEVEGGENVPVWDGSYEKITIPVIDNGGSNRCSGNHIIEVDTLPTENIDETALYKCGGAYYQCKNECKDIIIYDGAPMSYVAVAAAQGYTLQLFTVDNYENVTNPNPVMDHSTGTMIISMYYDTGRNDVFGYTEGAWTSLSEDSLTNGGAITDVSEATEDGHYYALVEQGWKPLGAEEYTGEVVIE